MLVLARKEKQSIRIGDDIVITVVSVQGDQVRIGISAPREVTVLRQELYQEVVDANVQASQTVSTADLLAALHNIQAKGQLKKQD